MSKTIFLATKFIFLIFFIIGDSYSDENKDDYDRKIYMGLSSPLSKRTVMYRWGSLQSGLNLLKEAYFNDKTFKYFMKMPFQENYMVGGRGLYVAETPYSSSRFIRQNAEGSLIEVIMEEGVPILDLNDPIILSKLNQHGLTGSPREIARIEPNLILKYKQSENRYNDWWVIKTQRGVKFQKFNSNRFNNEELKNIYNKLYSDKMGDRPKEVFLSRLSDEQKFFITGKSPSNQLIEEIIQKGSMEISVAYPYNRQEKQNFYKDKLLKNFNYFTTYLRTQPAKSLILLFNSFNFNNDEIEKTLNAVIQNNSIEKQWVIDFLKLSFALPKDDRLSQLPDSLKIEIYFKNIFNFFTQITTNNKSTFFKDILNISPHFFNQYIHLFSSAKNFKNEQYDDYLDFVKKIASSVNEEDFRIIYYPDLIQALPSSNTPLRNIGFRYSVLSAEEINDKTIIKLIKEKPTIAEFRRIIRYMDLNENLYTESSTEVINQYLKQFSNNEIQLWFSENSCNQYMQKSSSVCLRCNTAHLRRK